MEGGREAWERALLSLERERKAEARAGACQTLVELAAEHPELDHDAAAALPRLLADGQVDLRQGALVLARMVLVPEEAETLLVNHLRDRAPEVRMEAARQLGNLERPSSRGALAAALEDPWFPVRFEAARGMAALGHAAGLEVLIEALDRGPIRFAAVGALAALGDVRAIPALRRLFDRWLLPAFDRAHTAGALAKLGDAQAASWLVERTKRRGGVDRAHAIELLGEVKAEGAKARLLEIAADEKDPGRGAALRGLGRLGDPASMELLLGFARARTGATELWVDALFGLVYLRDPDAKAEVEAALREVGASDVRFELTELLQLAEEESAPS